MLLWHTARFQQYLSSQCTLDWWASKEIRSWAMLCGLEPKWIWVCTVLHSSLIAGIMYERDVIEREICFQVWTSQTTAECVNMPGNNIQRVAGQRWINLALADPSAYRALHTALKTLPFWQILGAGISRCLGIRLTALPIWFTCFYTTKLEVCAWYKVLCSLLSAEHCSPFFFLS